MSLKDAFISTWREQNVLPKEPTLDWMSLRHPDVFKMTAGEAAEAQKNLATIQ